MEKIVICGGHLAPALAVIEQLQKEKKYEIYYLGRKNALEGDKALSLEYNVIKKLHIPFEPVISGRLQRTLTWYTLPSLFKLPAALAQSFFLLLSVRPKIVISFGGYVALPICLAAGAAQIPVITHEQTHTLGLANKIISRMAKVLCLSFAETANIPDGVKTVYTGSLLRQSIFAKKYDKILDFGEKKLPLIYITGGNLGATSINRTVGQILSKLVSRFRILHQCGNANNEEDFRNLSNLKNSLSINHQKNYKVVTQIDPKIVGSIYRNASLVIGRAGANTVTEILAFGTPAILIPLPWAGQNEQGKNAATVKSAGLGNVILQSELTSQSLLDTISFMMANIDSYKNGSRKKRQLIKSDGSKKIVNLIDEYL